VTQLSRGTAWLDTGSPKGLQDAASYVQVIEERTGLKIACLEEIALLNSWISKLDIMKLVKSYGEGEYAKYLSMIAR
jgi:glucose-1-phosphate thymidylyltransferase